MWKWGSTTGLRALSVLYLLSASAFGIAIALQSQQPWAVGARQFAAVTGPLVISTAQTVNEQGVKPFIAWTGRTTTQIVEWMAPKSPVKAPVQVAAKPAKPYTLRPSLPPPAAPAVKPDATPAAPPTMELAQQETETSLMPAPDASPPPPGQVARVMAHLKVSLTKELYENFSLFLYVSKAEHGPWSQRMFVFAKQDSGDLTLRYSFPVSTGREVAMASPDGKAMWHTNTPTGYFQLDPERIYRRYASQQWGHPMPYAMFFSWEHDGLQTGVAIHSAVDGDVALLGSRASAGCVRLHPQNAQLLFNLIKKNYRGQTPLFAYDRRTATMDKDGLLMHDKAGNLEYADGYRVLVLIENNSGDDVVAALF